MSQKQAKPHVVRVYGYEEMDNELSQRLVRLREIECPSKGSAERYASEQRKLSEVSSAVVMPLQAPVGQCRTTPA